MAAFNGITLPVITDNGLSDARERRQILEALANLSKQLKHVLANLDVENLAPEMQEKIETAYQKAETSVNGINQVVEGMGGMRSRLTQAENNITAAVENAEGLESRLAITERGVAISVKQGEVISFINQSPEEITIMANKISLNGAVSANGTFYIDPSGYMICSGGQVGNLLTSGNTCIFANDGPFHIGGVTVQDGKIAGVTDMPHLVLTPYNMGMPINVPSGTQLVTWDGEKFGTVGLELGEEYNGTLGCYIYTLNFIGNDASSTGGPVDGTGLRIRGASGVWYTDAGLTEEGGTVSPLETFKHDSSGKTIGRMRYDEATGLWRRTDTVTRYFRYQDYYTFTVRMRTAGA